MISELLNFPLEFAVDVEYDQWKFKLLRPKQKLQRASYVANLLGNVPIDSVGSDDYSMAIIIGTLQVGYVSGPEWFKTQCKSEFSEIPDEDYLISLFKKYDKAEKDFEEAKKKSRHNGTGERRKVDNISAPVPEL